MEDNKRQMRNFALWFYLFGIVLCVLGGFRLYEFLLILDSDTESLSFFFGTILYMAYIAVGMMLIHYAIKVRRKVDSEEDDRIL